jgi:phosphonoacetaldehyde hydrolase
MDFIFRRSYCGPLRAIILDWAGTTVDFGSFAPTAVFMRMFESRGVPIPASYARKGMGLMKKDHLRTIFAFGDVRDRWAEKYGAPPTEADVDALFMDFVPMQVATVAEYAEPIPGLIEVVDNFRARGLKIGTTTGYTAPMMQALLPAAAAGGYQPDCVVTPSDVPAGRPAPWMCYQNAIQMQVYPFAAMVKAGDTIPDIEEGLNAGMWTIGLVLSGNLMGLTRDELAALAADEVERRRAAITTQLHQAGAHYVVDTIADVPAMLDEIAQRVARGERP